MIGRCELKGSEGLWAQPEALRTKKYLRMEQGQSKLVCGALGSLIGEVRVGSLGQWKGMERGRKELQVVPLRKEEVT